MRRSRFIAQVHTITSREQVDEIIQGVRESFPGAKHICFAYRIMDQGAELQEFSSDAGEPSGSAGRPILKVLRQNNLVDVVAWVARYFGGTKLGITGLMEAYTHAVQKCLVGVSPVPWIAMVEVNVILPYLLADRVKDEVRRIAGILHSEEYLEDVGLIVKIPRDNVQGFLNRLEELGKGDIKVSGDVIDFDGDHA